MTEEQNNKILRFQMTSDIFFSKVLEDKKACEEVLRIITGKIFRIEEVKSQYSIRQLATHSVILDIWAMAEKATIIHIEMHPRNDESHMQRIRYNTASVDMENLETGKEYEELPDVYGIYISHKQFVNRKLEDRVGIDHVVRIFHTAKEEASNGIHEYYVDLKGKCETREQDELLKYMVNADGIEDSDAFPNLVKRVRFLKENQGGKEVMCEILEQERKEGKIEGKIEERIYNLISLIMKKVRKGKPLEMIADEVECEVEKIYDLYQVIKECGERCTIEEVMEVVQKRRNGEWMKG
ncbi:MAG: PD-(D/E)XK nuclease family transposase [Eubacteriales bacterium]